ncbi:non-ribosomal peptide synthetase [Dyella sp. GSA-30]|uniref:non-ribosomal peptide synthetase n=1 Tax=Dyella sp. GSA-30 TaxID=2994496 RepID=UPI002491823F|nr:non-ribosomal peptide synthetase [Dyella sp. GSA-30]BDU21614.1 hypothetical protein DYGSA30_30710 [Dyella sp. GSA-30]
MLTLLDAIERHEQRQPDAIALRFLKDPDAAADEITYTELCERFRSFGKRLLLDEMSHERVIIACSSGIDYVVAILGCFFAGAVAVPYMAPRARMRARFVEMLVACDAAAVVVDSPADMAALGDLECVRAVRVYPGVRESAYPGERPGSARQNPIAYLQYTSGSTRRPKGVIVGHANLLANARMIQDVFAQDASSSWLGWLPLHHDMGLVGMIMHPLFCGITSTFMSPMTFVRDPLFWIMAISRYRATTAGGPNFSFELCARSYDATRLDGVDLSNWSVAFNGAETVSLETMRLFSDRYSGHGFRMEAFKPCYGLAEATLIVSAVGRQEPFQLAAGPDGKSRVGLGAPVSPARIRLFDSISGTLFDEPGRIGEICVGGPSVTVGYWGADADTDTMLVDSLGPLLRTGDLGYFADGQLTICGRTKEMMIVRGRNLYPTDLEHAVFEVKEPHRPQASAAFSVEVEGEEQVVLVIEVHRHTKQEALEAMADFIRRKVAEDFDIGLFSVVAVYHRSLPRTTSGKIQRMLCKQLFLEHKLSTLFEHHVAAPRTAQKVGAREDFETVLALILGRDLTIGDWQSHLTALGLDSLGASRLSALLRGKAGLVFPSQLLYNDATLWQIADALVPVPVPPAQNQRRSYDISEGQQALLLLHQAHPLSSRHTIARTLVFPSNPNCHDVRLHVERLLSSVDAARARFELSDSAQWQMRCDEQPLVLEQDFQRMEQAVDWVAQRCAEPWDVSSAPLVEVALLWLPGKTAVFVRAHHLVSDQQSVELLLRAIAPAFGGSVCAIPAGALGAQARREIQWLSGARRLHAEATFKRHLLEPLPYLDLHGKPRESLAAAGASLTLVLPDALHRSLPEICRQFHTTEYVVLLALFFVALARTTGEHDLVVGCAADCREEEADYATVDNYANLTPVRARLQPEMSVSGLIAQIRALVADMSDCRAYPFSRLVEYLRPTRRAGVLPLFETLFMTHRADSSGHAALIFGTSGETFSFAGVSAESLSTAIPELPFDLRCDVVCTPAQVLVKLEYRVELVSQQVIEDVARNYAEVAIAVANSPDHVVYGALARTEPLFGKAESSPWNDLPSSVVRCALEHPDSVAVIDCSGAHSYRELDQRSAAIAAKLRNLGVVDNACVALQLERNFDMVAALLGIWRAGCFYAPVPDTLPASRVEQLVSASASVMTVDEAFLSQLERAAAPERAGPRIAYRIFTSGTTGRPKCVDVTSAGLSNLLYAMQAELELNSADAFAATTSIGFDMAALEIWLPLMIGAKTVLLGKEDSMNGERFDAAIRSNGITVVQGTPSWYSNLVASQWQGNVGLRMISGGERLDWNLASQLLRRGEHLWNGYGPTETAVFSVVQKISSSGVAPATGSAPIGRPLPNTILLLLDHELQPTIRGDDGDLFIGGSGLADGYFGDPELTSQRFVSLPGQAQGQKFYRTGDRARMNADGTLEFRGRLDRQIKIKGHRLELAEVEAHLLDLSGVRQAFAFALAGDEGEQEIWAALVATSGDEANATDIDLRRQLLAKGVPAHAIPVRLKWFDHLPLNGSGKACVVSIAEDMRRHAPRATVLPALGDALQIQIAAAWQEVLGRAVDDIHTSFFDYGGTSLQLVRLQRAVSQRTGLSIDVLDLLHTGGVAHLAQRLQGSNHSILENRRPVSTTAMRRRRTDEESNQ